MPLIRTHGWPGSFIEMLDILPFLKDPGAHGHDAEDSFDLINPSLPGFGCSDKPVNSGMNFFQIADTWVELMDALGYERFVVHGGDLENTVSGCLPGCCQLGLKAQALCQ